MRLPIDVGWAELIQYISYFHNHDVFIKLSNVFVLSDVHSPAFVIFLIILFLFLRTLVRIVV